MAKKRSFNLLSFVAWLTGVIVSLAVGFALYGGTLSVPYLNKVPYLVEGAGVVVIITTILGVILALIDALK